MSGNNNSRVDVSNLPEALKDLRDKLFLSDTEFAEKMGISYTGYWKIVNRETKTLRRSTLRTLSENTGYDFAIKDNKIKFFKKTTEKIDFSGEADIEELLNRLQSTLASLEQSDLAILVAMAERMAGNE